MTIGVRTVAVGTDNGGSATVSATSDGTPVAGDLAIIIHGNDFYALTNMPTPTPTNMGALTAIVSADAGTNLAHIKAYWAVVTANGAVTASVTETGSHDEEKRMTVVVLSGADTTNPVDGTPTSASGGSSTSHVAPATSPVATDSFLICDTNSGGGAASASYTPPAGMTEQVEQHVGGLSSTTATKQLTASGSTGTQTFAAASAVPWAAISMAIKTASGAASPGPVIPLTSQYGSFH